MTDRLYSLVERANLICERQSKCRFLYLVGGLGTGGLERQLFFLLQATDREAFRPEVAVWTFSEHDPYVRQIRRLGVPLHSFPVTFSPTAKLRALRQLVKRIRPAVVHSYSFYTNVAAWWAVQGTSSIAIGSCRSTFEYERTESGPVLGRLSGCLPRYQICNSQMAKRTIETSHSPFVPKHSVVVRNGIDLASFQSTPVSSCGRAVILGIGSILPVKRWDRVIDLSVQLRRVGLDFQVRIAGDGPLRMSLERQAQERGVGDRVEFLGDRRDIPALLEESTFLIHASDIEGSPNAVMEAMACGRAVVATDVGDIPFLIEDGKTGFVVRCGDHQAMLERTIQLVSDRGLCQSMGEAGQARARHEFSLDRLVHQTLSAYRLAGWRERDDAPHAGPNESP